MVTARKGQLADIDKILALQANNLVTNMTEIEKINGFVTTPFSVELIQQMLAKNGCYVAVNPQNEVVAYVFVGVWEIYMQWDIFKYMVSRFPGIRFNGKAINTDNTFQYGPICIDKLHRGKGIINTIFECMRLDWSTSYDTSLTFINKANVVSTKAHIMKLGWRIVDEFDFNNNTYLSLALDIGSAPY